MCKDLMLSKMVKYRLLEMEPYNEHDYMKFLKENGWWHSDGRRRSVSWYNAYRLVTAFKCLYVREEDYYIPKEDKIDFANRVRDWEMKEVSVKDMIRRTYKLKYEQPGLQES